MLFRGNYGNGGPGGPIHFLSHDGMRAPRAYVEVDCFDKYGNLKWKETGFNLVVNDGKNDNLNKYFKGSTYTAAWFMLLKGAGTIALADTLASHGGWTEFTSYAGSRPSVTFGSVASQSVSNSGSPNSFSISGSGTVAGAGLCTVASGTSGILYNAVDFSASRTVGSGDTVNVTMTISIT